MDPSQIISVFIGFRHSRFEDVSQVVLIFDIGYWTKKNIPVHIHIIFFQPLTPANFLPNTPRQFIFTSHIARVEVCQKNFTQPSPTTPYPWVAPLKKLTFFTIIQPLTPANFLPNTPRQFIFTSHIARVEVYQKNFTQPSPTLPNQLNSSSVP